jgi:uncharacterized protein
MDPIKIIQKYYKSDSKTYRYLVAHSESVAKKALEVAKKVPELNPDLKFIEEASILHDIGIFLVNDSELECFGDKSYVCHGYLGRELLEKEGLPKHALVCERHVGVGITAEEIERRKLPMPVRDMLPISIEEEIVCFADKFFSKNDEFLTKEKPLEKIRADVGKFGKDREEKFNQWLKKFKNE